MLLVDRLVRYVLPPDADEDRRVRTRFAVAANLIFVVLAVTRAVQLTIAGAVPQGMVLSACAIAAMSLPFVLRRTESLAVMGHALTALVFIVMVRAAWMSGGPASPGVIALAVLPPIAIFIAGKRAGSIWIVAIGVAILTLAALDAAGFRANAVVPSQTIKAVTATGGLALALTTLALSLAYERSRESTLRRSTDSVERAEATLRQHDDLHAKRLQKLMELLAHEGGNTLSYIMSDIEFVELALQESDVKLALGEAYVGTRRLKEILEDARVLTDPAPSSIDSCDARAIIVSVMTRAAPVLDRLSIQREYDLGDVPLMVGASAHAVEVAMRNLVAGIDLEGTLAIKLTREPPRIVVEGTRGRPRSLGVEAARHLLEPFGGSIDVDWSSQSWRGVVRLPRVAPDEARDVSPGVSRGS